MNISRVIFNVFRYLPLLSQPKINVKNIVNINSASYCYPYCVVHVLFHLYKLQPRLWCILECILFPVLQCHRRHLVNNHYVRTPLRKALKGEEANNKRNGRHWNTNELGQCFSLYCYVYKKHQKVIMVQGSVSRKVPITLRARNQIFKSKYKE